MSPVAIREALPEDAAVLAVLLDEGALTAKEDPADVGAYRDALVAIAGDPATTVLVAVVDGAVVGMCQLLVFRHLQQRGGRCAEIESMHVAGSFRSHGIGAALLDAAVQRATEAGCYRVQLTSNTARPDAHRFYLRHGFEASHVGFKRYLPSR